MFVIQKNIRLYIYVLIIISCIIIFSDNSNATITLWSSGDAQVLRISNYNLAHVTSPNNPPSTWTVYLYDPNDDPTDPESQPLSTMSILSANYNCKFVNNDGSGGCLDTDTFLILNGKITERRHIKASFRHRSISSLSHTDYTAQPVPASSQLPSVNISIASIADKNGNSRNIDQNYIYSEDTITLRVESTDDNKIYDPSGITVPNNALPGADITRFLFLQAYKEGDTNIRKYSNFGGTQTVDRTHSNGKGVVVTGLTWKAPAVTQTTKFDIVIDVRDDIGQWGRGRLNLIVLRAGTEIPNRAPVLAEGTSPTFSIKENVPIGTYIPDPILVTDPDGDEFTIQYVGDVGFLFDRQTTQLYTTHALDYEKKNVYNMYISARDSHGNRSKISLTVNIIDVAESRPSPPPSQPSPTPSPTPPTPTPGPTNSNPVFTEDTNTTRSIDENTPSQTNIGNPISATDADTSDILTYSISGTDAASFSINSNTGQLITSTSLDYETKSVYQVVVSVSDGNGGSDSITITINIIDVAESGASPPPSQPSPTPGPTNSNPVFTEDTNATRSIDENTPSETNIGNPISATDADTSDILTYSMSGTDEASFSINSDTGQLITSAPLDYETKSSYQVVVSVSDGNGGSDSITITINVIDVDESNTEDTGQNISPPPPAYRNHNLKQITLYYLLITIVQM